VVDLSDRRTADRRDQQGAGDADERRHALDPGAAGEDEGDEGHRHRSGHGDEQRRPPVEDRGQHEARDEQQAEGQAAHGQQAAHADEDDCGDADRESQPQQRRAAVDLGKCVGSAGVVDTNRLAVIQRRREVDRADGDRYDAAAISSFIEAG
jgi:hypothetical protein